MKRKLLSRQAKARAKGLLDMLYTPQELAEELSIKRSQIYRHLLPAGMPHRRDDNGNLWLHGLTVAAWIRTIDRRYHSQVPDGQAYCVRCRTAVPLEQPRRTPHGKVDLLQAACPECGATLNRFTRREHRDQP